MRKIKKKRINDNKNLIMKLKIRMKLNTQRLISKIKEYKDRRHIKLHWEIT